MDTTTSGAALDNQKVTDLVDELVNCPICLQKFTKPKMLNCLHTFCQPCLEMSHRAALGRSRNIDPCTLSCPTCRDVTGLDEHGIQGLKTDFKVAKITDLLNQVGANDVSLSKVRTCNLCKYSGKYVTARYSCKNCSKYMCKGCYRQHKQIKVFSNHTVKDLKTATPVKPKNVETTAEMKASVCQKHKEMFRYYCRNCKVKVCTICVLRRHSTHKLLDLKQAGATR